MQTIVNHIYLTFTAAVKVYFGKSVYTVNESDQIILIDVIASRRYFFDKFSLEITSFVNKTFKPYYGNCLVTEHTNFFSWLQHSFLMLYVLYMYIHTLVFLFPQLLLLIFTTLLKV